MIPPVFMPMALIAIIAADEFRLLSSSANTLRAGVAAPASPAPAFRAVDDESIR